MFRCQERSGGVWVATSAALASSDINVLQVFVFVSTAGFYITAPALVKAKSCISRQQKATEIFLIMTIAALYASV